MATFTALNNTTYTLSPLVLGHFREFREWVQWLPYESFKRQKLRFENEGDYKEELAKLRGECARNRLREGSAEVISMQSEPEGIVKLICLSLKRNHPTVTEEEIESNLTIDGMKEAAEQLMIISGLVTEDEEPAKKKTKRS